MGKEESKRYLLAQGSDLDEAMAFSTPPHTATIERLGVEVFLGTGIDPLRTKRPPDGSDLLRSAKNQGLSRRHLTNILALQLAHFKTPEGSPPMKPGAKDYLEAIGIITGWKPLPFLVAQTTTAIIEHSVPGWCTHPQKFVTNYKRYQPPNEVLQKIGIRKTQIEKAQNRPAVLTGSALIIEGDAIEGDHVFMRQETGGIHDGLWTIPGGKANSFNEVAALERQLEKAILPMEARCDMRPLGAIDEILITQGAEGTYELKRYLNLAWVILTKRQPQVREFPEDGDGGGNWIPIHIDNFCDMIENKKMTPAAEISIRLWFTHINYYLRNGESYLS